MCKKMEYGGLLEMVKNKNTNDVLGFCENYIFVKVLVFKKFGKNKAKQSENVSCF